MAAKMQTRPVIRSHNGYSVWRFGKRVTDVYPSPRLAWAEYRLRTLS